MDDRMVFMINVYHDVNWDQDRKFNLPVHDYDIADALNKSRNIFEHNFKKPPIRLKNVLKKKSTEI